MELKELRKKCIKEAKRKVSGSVGEDDFIIQAIKNIDELGKTSSALTQRVRDWYGLHFPEAVRKIKDNEAFIREISIKSKEELMRELGVEDTMGGDLSEFNLEPILEYVDVVKRTNEMKEKVEEYLEALMASYCPNVQAVAGTTVGARLLDEAGSLKKLATLPSTTIQLLGAEKALFRHLKTGAKPPRHGHLFAHRLVQEAKDEDRGKVARAVADKTALAARADYFGEKFIGEKLVEELEERFDGP